MRITRKMRRELKQSVNYLEELLIIIKQYFHKFYITNGSYKYQKLYYFGL